MNINEMFGKWGNEPKTTPVTGEQFKKAYVKVLEEREGNSNREPEEVKSTLCPEKFHDVLTHRDNWRDCIVFKKSLCSNFADRSYWEHELRAFDRTFELLEKAIGEL